MSGSLHFPSEIACKVGSRLAMEDFVRGRMREGFRLERVLQPSMGEGMMLALDNIANADSGGILSRDAEAHRIEILVLRKAAAVAARVTEIAAGQGGVFRLGARAADTAPKISQRQPCVLGPAARPRLDRIETRTAHFGV